LLFEDAGICFSRCRIDAPFELQKQLALTKQRLNDLRSPSSKPKVVQKGVDLNLSPDDIVERMEQLKDKVVTEQDAAERDRIVSRIQALNNSYVQLTQNGEGSKSQYDGQLQATLEQDLTRMQQEMNEIKKQESTQRAAVEDMREKINASQPTIDKLRQEREVCISVVKSLRAKITEINEEYSQKFTEYREALTQWNADMDVIMAEKCAPMMSCQSCVLGAFTLCPLCPRFRTSKPA
jgi:DNA repair exonuclease SbcCD ATPase subunit